MTTTTQADVRDIEAGATYYGVTKPNGRLLMAGMFVAAWTTKAGAKAAATEAGPGHTVVKQKKPE